VGILQGDSIPFRLEFRNRHAHNFKDDELAHVMNKHTEEEQEGNEHDCGLELNSAALSPSKVEENLVCQILELFACEVSLSKVVLLGNRVVVVVEVDVSGGLDVVYQLSVVCDEDIGLQVFISFFRIATKRVFRLVSESLLSCRRTDFSAAILSSNKALSVVLVRERVVHRKGDVFPSFFNFVFLVLFNCIFDASNLGLGYASNRGVE